MLVSSGIALSEKEKYARALNDFKQSRAIKDNLGLEDSRGYADLLFEMAFAYSRESQLDLALEYYRESRAIQEKLGLRYRSEYKNTLFNIKLLSRLKHEREKFENQFK